MADTSSSAPALGITDTGFLTDSWYLGAVSSELKAGEQFRSVILGEPVMLGRTKTGEPFALRDICPHRLVQATDPSRVRVRRYPVHEANGALFVYIAHDPRSDADPALPPPDFGPLPAKPKFTLSRTFNAHMDDAVVGLMDPAHVPFVHSQWWWRPPSAGLKLKEKPFEPRPRGWAIAKHTPSSNSLPYRIVFGGAVTTEIIFQLPGFRWEIVENETTRLLTLTCLTPLGPKETRVTQLTWWTGAPLLNLAIPILKPAGRKFLDQDADMVDLQNSNANGKTPAPRRATSSIRSSRSRCAG